MRTTVDLDEDILQLIRDLAREREQSFGRVISDLVRQGLQPRVLRGRRAGAIPTLPRKAGARPVTAEAVKELLEAEG